MTETERTEVAALVEFEIVEPRGKAKKKDMPDTDGARLYVFEFAETVSLGRRRQSNVRK